MERSNRGLPWKPVDNDSAYVAAASPLNAESIEPPLLPLPGVSPYLWRKHHELYTQANIPEHIFLGTVMAEPTDPPKMRRDYSPRWPFYLHVPILNEHLYVNGPPGTGKTSLVVTQINRGLIHGYKTKSGALSDPFPIVVVDLGRDELMFHATKKAAEERGQRFRFFSIEGFHPTYRFNPFACFDTSKHSISVIAQTLGEAIGLNHGIGYGREYFTIFSIALLTQTFRRYPKIRSFKQLGEAVDQTWKQVNKGESNFQKKKNEAEQMIYTIEMLSEHRQLMTEEGEDYASDVIHPPRILEESEVVYFWLPASLMSISSRIVGNLVLGCVSLAAHDRKKEKPGDPRRVYMTVDEFQAVATERFPSFLQHARHDRLSLILANQSINDLVFPNGFDLRHVLLEYPRAKIFFDTTKQGVFRYFSRLGSGRTPAAEAFPSENSADLSSLHTEGSSVGINNGESVTNASSESTGDSIATTEGEAASVGEGEHHSKGKGHADMSGISEGYSVSVPRLEEWPYTYFGNTTRSKGSHQASSDSVLATEGQSILRTSTKTGSTTSGKTEVRTTGESRGSSTGKSSGAASQWPIFGNHYAGFSVWTTWHVSEDQKNEIERVGWPSWDSIPRPEPKPQTLAPADEMKLPAKNRGETRQAQQMSMEMLFEKPLSPTPPKAQKKRPKNAKTPGEQGSA